jgi:hypothetical protein
MDRFMQHEAPRRFPRGRRAAFLLGLALIAIAPATLIPTAAVPDEVEEEWPFSIVPQAAWRGDAPTSEEAGNVVPVEFRLGGYRGLDVLSPDPPISIAVDCDTRAPRAIPTPPASPAEGVLTYYLFTDTYTFWWPRPNSWVGTCRSLMLQLSDESLHPVMVHFGETSNVFVG